MGPTSQNGKLKSSGARGAREVARLMQETCRSSMAWMKRVGATTRVGWSEGRDWHQPLELASPAIAHAVRGISSGPGRASTSRRVRLPATAASRCAR